MLENAKGISSEIKVSQFVAAKLPERFEVVVGEQVREHIFGIEVVKASLEPIALQEWRIAHPGVERIRHDVIVRVPVAISVIISFDGQFGVQTVRTDAIVREHRDAQGPDGVFPVIGDPVLEDFRERSLPFSSTPFHVLDIEDAYDRELLALPDDAVVLPFVELPLTGVLLVGEFYTAVRASSSSALPSMSTINTDASVRFRAVDGIVRNDVLDCPSCLSSGDAWQRRGEFINPPLQFIPRSHQSNENSSCSSSCLGCATLGFFPVDLSRDISSWRTFSLACWRISSISSGVSST